MQKLRNLHFSSPIFLLLPRDVVGIALCGHCFFRYSKENTSKTTILHELIHCYQIREDGCIKFYLTYLLDYLRLRCRGMSHLDAYFNIPYEIEAYEGQNVKERLEWLKTKLET